MRNVEASVSLYFVSDDLDAVIIREQMNIRASQANIEMLESAQEKLTADPRAIAMMLFRTMAGVSRGLLESGSPEKQIGTIRRELIVLTRACLQACV